MVITMVQVHFLSGRSPKQAKPIRHRLAAREPVAGGAQAAGRWSERLAVQVVHTKPRDCEDEGGKVGGGQRLSQDERSKDGSPKV